jgi:hypothetical protein
VPSTAVDNSPGGQSERQSNEINELSGNFDTANCSDGQINGEADEDLVVGTRYFLPSIVFSIK